AADLDRHRDDPRVDRPPRRNLGRARQRPKLRSGGPADAHLHTVLAGLLMRTSTQLVSKVPWIGDIPILGALFRSDRFQRGEANRLDRLVVAGNIRPADRVVIAAAGSPGLAERRAAAISSELLRYGIVAQSLVLDTVPANRAILSVGRYAVTLPACPDWSQS